MSIQYLVQKNRQKVNIKTLSALIDCMRLYPNNWKNKMSLNIILIYNVNKEE